MIIALRKKSHIWAHIITNAKSAVKRLYAIVYAMGISGLIKNKISV